MRHPFWKWTGWLSWLSVGLSGCLHGQDWRAAVSKPLTRPVADRRETPLQPKVIGPLRKSKTTFVPPTSIPAPAVVALPPTHASVPAASGPRSLPSKLNASPMGHVTPSAITARPPALTASDKNRASRISTEAIRPPTTQDEAQPRGAKVLEAEFIPPPVPPAAPPPSLLPAQTPVSPITAKVLPVVQAVAAPPPSVNVQTPTRGGFAEFERRIPVKNDAETNLQFHSSPTRKRGTMPADPRLRVGLGSSASDGVISAPFVRNTGVTQESTPPADDNEIVVVPEREPTTPPPMPLIVPAGRYVPISQLVVPQSLPTESAKELPDVSDIITTEPDSPNADLERIARPRDVAVLVEQVFEDLRQRRLDQARQRTAWLKQIVTRRELAVEEASAAKPVSVSAEPQRLNLDPNAVPVDKAPSEKLLDDEPSINRP
ncbi:MAG: hypothetical protein IAG10_13795 [Planctomycetaceae bacterium]|nr:hypothetical protein [Planctomycetaceae bacterium]